MLLREEGGGKEREREKSKGDDKYLTPYVGTISTLHANLHQYK